MSAPVSGTQPELLPDLAYRFGLVHRVDMQTWRAAIQQLLAQVLYNFDTKFTNALTVVTIGLQTLANPAWNFRAAVVAEALQVGVIGDGHDARHNRDFNADLAAGIHKIKIG